MHFAKLKMNIDGRRETVLFCILYYLPHFIFPSLCQLLHHSYVTLILFPFLCREYDMLLYSRRDCCLRFKCYFHLISFFFPLPLQFMKFYFVSFSRWISLHCVEREFWFEPNVTQKRRKNQKFSPENIFYSWISCSIHSSVPKMCLNAESWEWFALEFDSLLELHHE